MPRLLRLRIFARSLQARNSSNSSFDIVSITTSGRPAPKSVFHAPRRNFRQRGVVNKCIVSQAGFGTFVVCFMGLLFAAGCPRLGALLHPVSFEVNKRRGLRRGINGFVIAVRSTRSRQKT